MSITDELREYVIRVHRNGWFDRRVCDDLLEITDRIDAEHERMYEALTIGMEPMTEENMARNGWVKLPVDADGVPINVGDEVVDVDCPKKPHLVAELRLDSITWSIFMSSFTLLPSRCRHVQPDTWERIIEDAANLVRGDNESVVGLVERCRRLAGEA